MKKMYKLYKRVKEGSDICLNPNEDLTMEQAEGKVFMLQKQFPGVKFEIKESNKKIIYG